MSQAGPASFLEEQQLEGPTSAHGLAGAVRPQGRTGGRWPRGQRGRPGLQQQEECVRVAEHAPLSWVGSLALCSV